MADTLTEAEALARAVEALRAAKIAAREIETYAPLDLISAYPDLLGDDAREVLAVLALVRAGYHVTPPTVQHDALPGGDPPPPPPPHG